MVQVEDETVMTRFLMGEPTDEEWEAIEKRLSADPGYFEAMSAFEDELILRWHRGELEADERRQFSRAYLSSPSRRARVEAARHLIEAAARWTSRSEAVPFWLRAARWIDPRGHMPPVLVTVTMVGLVAALPLLAYQAAWWRGEARRLQQEVAEIATRTRATLRVAVVTLAPVRDYRSGGQARATEPPGGPAREGTLGGVAREAEDRQREPLVVRITPETDRVELQILIEDVRGTPLLSAELHAPGRAMPEDVGPLWIAPGTAGVEIRLVLAAGPLTEGAYVLLIRAEGEDVAARTFRVVRE